MPRHQIPILLLRHQRPDHDTATGCSGGERPLQQENLIDQFKHGVRALHAPLNTLDANWAYMVIASLAWSLKAWFAMKIPTSPRWHAKHEAEREQVLRMDFRTFVQQLILVPAQILRTGRQLVYRLLAWRPMLPILLRLHHALC